MQDDITKAVKKAFPELAGGLHLDRYGRVLGMSDGPNQGASSERFRPRLAVDIEILTPELEPDPAYPVYTAVPLPVPMGAGQESGSFAAPEAGSLVVVGFAYGRQDHPIIRQIYALGSSLPQLAPGEILLQKDPAVFQRADQGGNWLRHTDAAIEDSSIDRKVTAVSSVSELGSEKKQVSEHSQTEVGSTWTTEAGTVATVLAGVRADLGSLGNLNLTAGANSTHTTSGEAEETVGGNHASTVKGNRAIKIDGGRVEKIGQALGVEVGESQTVKVGQESKEEVGADKIIQAANILLQAKGTFTLTGFDGEINLLNELGSALQEIKAALDVLASHNHPDAGTINQGGAVAGHSSSLGGHIGNLGQVSG